MQEMEFQWLYLKMLLQKMIPHVISHVILEHTHVEFL